MSRGEAINSALKEHQTTAEDWERRVLLADLHEWADRFSVQFKLDIPVAALVVDRLRGTYLGHFRRGRNAWGLNYEIAIREGIVMAGPRWKRYGTLLHELLHLWQAVHGTPPASTAWNYHNKQYRTKAMALGLIVDRKGRTTYARENSPFLALLRKHGIDVSDLPPEAKQAAPAERLGTSNIKLWECKCPVRVRVAIKEFHARCLDCGEIFELKDVPRGSGT
jgi:hypothetical protein